MPDEDSWQVESATFDEDSWQVESETPEEVSIGIEECEKLSRALGYRLDNADFMQDDKKYNLVVSTPGAKDVLTVRFTLAFGGLGHACQGSAVQIVCKIADDRILVAAHCVHYNQSLHMLQALRVLQSVRVLQVLQSCWEHPVGVGYSFCQ